MAASMPALFVGHGNPMHALADNEWTRAWRALGRALPKPKAILSVSAHWYVPGTFVTTAERPRTIHDFGGFPRELFEMRYPAPGSPELARRVRAALGEEAVNEDEGSWGLDHGTWSVLVHLYPDADVPVVQLSIDETLPARAHYALAQGLGALRDEGILVLGSGNVVHNLHAYGWGRRVPEPYDWAVRFERFVRERIAAGDDAAVAAYEEQGRDATLSAPTSDHFLPLLYVLGTRRAGDAVSFPVEGVDGGSISMLSVKVG